MIKSVFLIGLGGATGCISRFLINFLFTKYTQYSGFPLGTFFINLVGSFLIGFFFYWIKQTSSYLYLHSFLIVGFLGGFTTFSTFSLETLQLLQQKEFFKCFLYTFGSCFLGLFFCLLGFLIAQKYTS